MSILRIMGAGGRNWLLCIDGVSGYTVLSSKYHNVHGWRLYRQPTFNRKQACLFVQQILDVPARPMHFFSDTLQYNRNTYVL
jgi:hypothetical protein